MVKPQVALIGVGENNKFGHPNVEVLQRLEELDCKVYRTDKMGEISVRTTGKGKITVEKFLKE